MIDVNGLHKSYGDKSVLQGLTFSVPIGKITGLVGPNGSGKSSTIRILTGFADADSGTVTVLGEAMSVTAVAVKRLIGYAPESAPLYREQTVREYLAFVARLRGTRTHALAQEIERVVNTFTLHKVVDQAIGTLSKGYRHRVSLAQCLLGDPPIIVLDEPTDGLDPLQKIETRNVILRLAETKAVLLTTHLIEDVRLLCDRVVALEQGKVVFEGDMKSLSGGQSFYLRLAEVTRVRATRVLGNIAGVMSFEFDTERLGDESRSDGAQHGGGFQTIRLRFKRDFESIDVLNEVSRCLHREGIRLVEASRQDTPFINLFSFWRQKSNDREGSTQ